MTSRAARGRQRPSRFTYAGQSVVATSNDGGSSTHGPLKVMDEDQAGRRFIGHGHRLVAAAEQAARHLLAGHRERQVVTPCAVDEQVAQVQRLLAKPELFDDTS